MFKKSIVALITPFLKDQIDEGAVEALVAWHLAQGTSALVVGGCTGEGPSLSHEEHRVLIRRARASTGGRLPLIAAASTFTTKDAVFLARQAEKEGADALMVLTPPCLKPNQEGLFLHMKAVHDAAALPLMIYHNPGRTGGALHDDTLARLADLPRIAALKDSTDTLSWPLSLRLRFGDRFALLSGEDPTFVAFLAQGGDGTVSVTANVAPKLYAALHDAWYAQDLAKVARIRDRLFPLTKALFCTTNPIPVKYAVSLLGHCRDEMRLPLVPPTPKEARLIKDALITAELLDA
ncbi:MAG: 4-hydroxy-tetrahydrodipicolinate synthase [Alphaproteobacteria bacterium]|jgi:4-hydroxy-tetrahydrodipicolinate synthase|nr:4-hydroxy-tetrahydrodipicolinate synthase [Alphaproteobacteria bacterium]